MRIQTSLEFMLVLGSISMLILASVFIYKNNVATNYNAIAYALKEPNVTSIPVVANSTNASSGNVYMAVYLPVNSTLYKQSQLYMVIYGCADGNADISFFSNSIEVSQSQASIDLKSITAFQTSFTPTSIGGDALRLEYSETCGNVTKSGNSTFYTYASPSSQAANQSAASAYIYTNKEEEEYPVAATRVYSVHEWSHCAYGNPIDGVLPLWVQCGTENAWGYMIFSDYCYTISGTGYSMYEYYCIAPEQTGYSIEAADTGAMSYVYNVSLVISTPYSELKSNITSTLQRAEVYTSGVPVGYASVKRVGGASIINQLVLLEGPDASGSVNSTAYQQYLQNMNNMYGVLSYYNNTGVSASTQSSIQQSIAAFSASSQALIESTTSPFACSLCGNYMLCNATAPFSYDILVNVSNVGVGNATIYTAGSTINLQGQ